MALRGASDGRGAGRGSRRRTRRFALVFHSFSTFLGRPGIYLEDWYVRREFRGRGIGRALLVHLARLARKRGCGRLELWVLDWNEQAIGLYKGIGASPLREWTIYRVTGEAPQSLALGP